METRDVSSSDWTAPGGGYTAFRLLGAALCSFAAEATPLARVLQT
jgi:hypothetical protein